jgi:hypothetical protein
MLLELNQIETLKRAINLALDEVYARDLYLIANKVHERSIVCRFCIYLQRVFDTPLFPFADFQLDFEYNRNYANPKKTTNFPKGTYPDLILHQRGSNDNNLCLFEFKTWWDADTGRDVQKLEDFTTQDGAYKYGIGFSILFGRSRSQVVPRVFTNGTEINEALNINRPNINN